MVSRNKFVTGLIAGAAVGAAAGLLFAPKPGKETRHVVSARAGDLRQKAGSYVGTMRQRMRKGGSDRASEASSNDHVEADH